MPPSDASAPDLLVVTGIGSAAIGHRAAVAGIELHELTPERGSLEETFMDLTRDAVEYHAHDTRKAA